MSTFSSTRARVHRKIGTWATPRAPSSTSALRADPPVNGLLTPDATPGETEADFEPFVWKDGGELTHQRLLTLSGAEPGTPVEEMTLDDFFRAVPSEVKARFQKLTRALQDQLSVVKVYKLGEEAEKEVYIVGKTKDGRWAGLKTSVVET
jgi:hypothetical protein